MPLIIHVNKSDLTKGEVIRPEWYEVQVKHVYAKPSKDNQSVNYWIVLSFPALDDREIEHNFNSKALGVSLHLFLAACKGIPVNEFLQQFPKEADLDLEQTIGKKLMAKIINTTFEGRIQNKVETFATLGKIPF